MCGISGFQYSDQSIIDLKERKNRLKSTIVAQKNRGPDSNGSFISDCNSTFLGHTRLARLRSQGKPTIFFQRSKILHCL